MCEAAPCASLPSEMRFGGLPQAGVNSQAAQHGTTPLYLCTVPWATKVFYKVSHCFPVVRRESSPHEKWSYTLFPWTGNIQWVGQYGGHIGSIWSVGSISLKQISAFKHQQNANKLNTASINALYEYYPFWGYSPKERQLASELDSCQSWRARLNLSTPTPLCLAFHLLRDYLGATSCPLAQEKSISEG